MSRSCYYGSNIIPALCLVYYDGYCIVDLRLVRPCIFMGSLRYLISILFDMCFGRATLCFLCTGHHCEFVIRA